MENKGFEFLEHTADLKCRVTGSTLQEIFENTAKAFSAYVTSGEKVSSPKYKSVDVKGEDTESLLYNFLDELIYLLDVEKFIISKASITLRGNNLRAEFYGDSTDKYEIKQVKAATYSEMLIKKLKSGSWEAVFVLDI